MPPTNEERLSAKTINADIESHVHKIDSELRAGFEFLRQYPRSVSIFGSARTTPKSPHYEQAEKLGNRIVSELGYTVITGGGPGIMEAANKGAHHAEKGKLVGHASLGLAIKLPREQHSNPYVDKEVAFEYFFTRKAMLNFAAEAYVFFPGGFGTFDELFGIVTLIQTVKIPRVPIILVGKDFWNPIVHFIKTNMLEKHHNIAPDDMNLFAVTDNIDTAMEMIKRAPVSDWWRMAD